MSSKLTGGKEQGKEGGGGEREQEVEMPGGVSPLTSEQRALLLLILPYYGNLKEPPFLLIYGIHN